MPSTAEIRQFLMEYFSDDEITSLCFDYFRDVYDDFSQGMAKGQKVQLLIAYCERRDFTARLQAALRNARPEQYARQFPDADVESFSPPQKRDRDRKQIFVSHAHQDAEFAHRLAADLIARGWKVWIAPESIQPGEKWVEAVERGLEESGIFIAVLTPDAVNSRWVKTETDTAIDWEHQNRLRLIPIELKNCNPPALWNLYQRVDFKADYASGLNNLLAALQKPGSSVEEVDGLIVQAQDLLKQRRFDEAVRLMRQSRQRYGGRPAFDEAYLEVLYQSGVHWYFDQRDLPKAEQAFQEVVGIDYSYKQAASYLRDIKRRLALPEAAPTVQQAAPARSRRSWIPLGVAIISLLACVAAWLVVPEFRQFLGLDKLTPTSIAVNPTHTATPTPGPTATPTTTPAPTSTPTITPTPDPCVCRGKTDEESLRCLIDSESAAANKADNNLIVQIFAPDAIIENWNPHDIWYSPLLYYPTKFNEGKFSNAQHLDIEVSPIDGQTAYARSGSKGEYTPNDRGMVPYNNPYPSDHWTFGKNAQRCWVITRFEFNAAHIPFPPTPQP